MTALSGVRTQSKIDAAVVSESRDDPSKGLRLFVKRPTRGIRLNGKHAVGLGVEQTADRLCLSQEPVGEWLDFDRDRF